MRIAYEIDGPPNSPALVAVHPLGLSREVWRPWLAAWRHCFRVLTVDLRGHGGSALPPGPYSIEELASDLLELLDELAIERVSYCGMSIGGAIGLRLAAHAPERVDRLVIACASARFGEPGPWRERAALVRAGGLNAIEDFALRRWFTPGFRAREPGIVARYRAMLLATPPEGYAACCDALAEWDLRDRLGEITAPTLVIGGTEDPASPIAHVREIRHGIAGARLAVLPDAAHMAPIEQPEQFARLTADHLRPSARALRALT
jgi:3-oxoadipate enol-lactonase